MTFALTIKTSADLAAEAAEALQSQIASAVDGAVEAQARSMGYNSAAACAGYRDSNVPAWAAESQAFIAWRDGVWQTVFALQAQYEQAQNVPTIEDVLSALPAWGA